MAMTDGDRLATDGQFGAVTESAVRAYQEQSGLSVDGVAGRQTMTALGVWEEPANAPPPTVAFVSANDCDPHYPSVCIPLQSRDLDCDDVPFSNFEVLPPDPHRFDSDHDSDLIGCE